jgi:hypothetical protein
MDFSSSREEPLLNINDISIKIIDRFDTRMLNITTGVYITCIRLADITAINIRLCIYRPIVSMWSGSGDNDAERKKQY